MIHELKTLPEYFNAVRSGEKKFELRKDDRDFRVDDFLALNEWDGEKYTGRTELVQITYKINPNDIMNCQGGFCILSIYPVDRYTFDSSRRSEVELSPCKGCPDHNVTPEYNCHSHCEKYISYDQNNAALRHQRQVQQSVDSYIAHTIAKNIRRDAKYGIRKES